MLIIHRAYGFTSLDVFDQIAAGFIKNCVTFFVTNKQAQFHFPKKCDYYNERLIYNNKKKPQLFFFKSKNSKYNEFIITFP